MKWLFCKTTDITTEEYNVIYKGLSSSRKAHIDRMKKLEDKQRSLAATKLLTRLLAECGESDFALETLENGKPQLVGSNLFFSLSHSGEGVVAAVDSQPIGIDIEKIKPIDEKLIDYVCKAKEKEYVLSEKASADYRFLTVWTAKEAFYKKNGSVGVRAVDTTLFQKSVHKIEDFIITIV